MMIQIANRETHHLRQALQKWPIIELELFLSQIMDMSMDAHENWQVVSILHFRNVFTLLPGVTTAQAGRIWIPHETERISSL